MRAQASRVSLTRFRLEMRPVSSYGRGEDAVGEGAIGYAGGFELGCV